MDDLKSACRDLQREQQKCEKEALKLENQIKSDAAKGVSRVYFFIFLTLGCIKDKSRYIS